MEALRVQRDQQPHRRRGRPFAAGPVALGAREDPRRLRRHDGGGTARRGGRRARVAERLPRPPGGRSARAWRGAGRRRPDARRGGSGRSGAGALRTERQHRARSACALGAVGPGPGLNPPKGGSGDAAFRGRFTGSKRTVAGSQLPERSTEARMSLRTRCRPARFRAFGAGLLVCGFSLTAPLAGADVGDPQAYVPKALLQAAAANPGAAFKVIVQGTGATASGAVATDVRGESAADPGQGKGSRPPVLLDQRCRRGAHRETDPEARQEGAESSRSPRTHRCRAPTPGILRPTCRRRRSTACRRRE